MWAMWDHLDSRLKSQSDPKAEVAVGRLWGDLARDPPRRVVVAEEVGG